ncbi:MAG: translation elongation factor 4 [Victivallales bacterium]|nr:translation elongation factor 4 [Victivallales bacterium]MCF7888716.1 translation elongation factor 4 [Victivallales bacterium]
MKKRVDKNNIRNFSIIAHIDHGKSTLADRILQATFSVNERDFHDQILDDMDLEQERGITIKSHPVRMNYVKENGGEYELNLIDTPGHVDFSYEVSRSLAACEGALLLIDAAQGVQAQTVANAKLAMQQNLVIIPVINKIDLPAANIEMCYEQLEEILAIPKEEVLLVSAKDGTGVTAVLQAIVELIPPPEKPYGVKGTSALIFDSNYNAYRGVVNYIKVVSGYLRKGHKIRLFSNDIESEIKEVGYFKLGMNASEKLNEGSVGYIIANIKSPGDTKIGDTLTRIDDISSKPLPGFKEIKPMVFSGIYPVDTADYEQLKANMAKLQLNDAAFDYQAESSVALGFGFRCGFLGLLHMEIVQERLRREYNMDIISTYPSVIYYVYLKDGKLEKIDNPINLPDVTKIDRIEEPVIKADILSPNDYIGEVMNLVMTKRGECTSTESVDGNHVMIEAVIPLHEILIDFHDKLKSVTRGYGSLDYESFGYQKADLVKMDILINGESVDAFSSIVHRDMAESRGRQIAERLKEVIPQQMFQVPIQAAVGGKVIARETIKQLRKNVLAKCYGGDVTRKRKLLEKQKAGKKKMKQIGKLNVPQEAFVEVLKTSK